MPLAPVFAMHRRPAAAVYPAKDSEHDLEVVLGRRPEVTALAVQGRDAEETHPIWAYDPLLALPTGGNPQTIHVKLVEGGDHVTAGFSLQAAGPYHVGGCSWKCGDEPLFVTFKMAEGIAEVACSELPRSEPHSATQYMCIPPRGATYDLMVLFAPTVPLERLVADIVLKFVVVPGLGASGGGGGGLGVGWGGSQPVPTVS